MNISSDKTPKNPIYHIREAYGYKYELYDEDGNGTIDRVRRSFIDGCNRYVEEAKKLNIKDNPKTMHDIALKHIFEEDKSWLQQQGAQYIPLKKEDACKERA